MEPLDLEQRLLFAEVGIESLIQLLGERGVVTKAEFWERMNAIMTQLNEQAQSVSQPAVTDSTDTVAAPKAKRRRNRRSRDKSAQS